MGTAILFTTNLRYFILYRNVSGEKRAVYIITFISIENTVIVNFVLNGMVPMQHKVNTKKQKVLPTADFSRIKTIKIKQFIRNYLDCHHNLLYAYKCYAVMACYDVLRRRR